MPNILMIDDDKDLTDSLTLFFKKHHLELVVANDPLVGLDLIGEAHPALLLLDVMMPKVDGFTLCKQVREKSALPIIMLTARGKLEDKIYGFELGVDDYLPKPFEPLELLARVQALLRRSELQGPTEETLNMMIQFSGLDIIASQQRVNVDGVDIQLSGMEFHLLHTLATHPGKVFNREQIIGVLKGVEVDLYGRAVDILLSRLRQKLNDSATSPRFIKTIRGMGYTFIAKPL
ncbi:response regulator transcription factor [Thalassotalea sp. M1531]|uniref:Response regulator transcription factor n=1 Tax=Thalassotalea algicola TaxID=2716224 RepID=A0A7Y0LCN8_9GAMM|nr:response regulator transcription factor [Thalassotalea algicola]NMP30655.1 response regulator transcription factor [Thalassotalea algicola]